jgi:hypothetical protein
MQSMAPVINNNNVVASNKCEGTIECSTQLGSAAVNTPPRSPDSLVIGTDQCVDGRYVLPPPPCALTPTQ